MKDIANGFAILIARGNSTWGLLRTVEDAGNVANRKAEAEHEASGFRSMFPTDYIIVSRQYVDKCRPINNPNGFVGATPA